jgi:chromosome segregation ATPase
MGCGGSKSTEVAVPDPPKNTTKPQTAPQKTSSPAPAEVKHDDVDLKLISESSKAPKSDGGAVMLDADLTSKDESLISDIIQIESSMRDIQEAREEEDAKILDMQMAVAEAANSEAIHEKSAEQAMEEAKALEEEEKRLLQEEEETKAKLQAAEEERLRLEEERQRQEDEAKQKELEVRSAESCHDNLIAHLPTFDLGIYSCCGSGSCRGCEKA